MKETHKDAVYEFHLEKYREFQEESGEDFTEINEEEVVSMLMKGKFEDLGGLTAIRGFVYQYYVAIYYILKMIQDPQKSWWDKVVFEYFDDVALLSDEQIRFIQVKTVREDRTNKLKPNDFYKRSKSRKLAADDAEHFDSWIDKLFRNYDLFLVKKNDEGFGDFLESQSFDDPQFELVSNTPNSSLGELEAYTLNTSFSAEISKDPKLKENIETPVVFENREIAFEDVFSYSTDFYLKRLYINKLGSFDTLKKTIEGLIEDIIDVNHPIKKTIIEEIFSNLISEIVQSTYRDDQEMDKAKLVFRKEEVEILLHKWCESSKDSAAKFLDDDSHLKVIQYLLDELRNELQEEFQANQKLLQEVVNTVDWFKTEFENQFRENSSYCLVFLNKLFNLQSLIKVESFFSDKNRQHIKKSLSYIIMCLVFYPNKQIEFEDSQLLFHTGKIEDVNLLFTIHNDRNKSSTIVVKNTVISALQQCEYGSNITQELFSLIVDEKEDKSTGKSKTSDRLAAKYSFAKVEKDQESIIEPPDNLNFINRDEVDNFFEIFKNSKEEDVSTFQDKEIEADWKISLLEG